MQVQQWFGQIADMIVPLEDLLGVRPPRYLDYDKAKFAARDLKSLAADGPVNQDQIKRLTRAGMGPCQGRICGPVVSEILAARLGRTVEEVGYYRVRAPLKPVSVAEMAGAEPG